MIEFTDTQGRVIVVTARFKHSNDQSQEAAAETRDLINAGIKVEKNMRRDGAKFAREAVVLP